MQQLLSEADTIFEELIQDLPAETQTMAREFSAFSRARKVKTPLQLMRIVMIYCGLDYNLRETAADFTLLYEQISDTAVGQRLAACLPWVKAVMEKIFCLPAMVRTANGYRFLVLDASTISSPGATGISYRVHICMDMLKLEFVSIKISDAHRGETLKNFSFSAGDVIVADRGYSHANGIRWAIDNGAHLIVRLNPHTLALQQTNGENLQISSALQGQDYGTYGSLAVKLALNNGETLKAFVHAYHLPLAQAQAARRRCYQAAKKQGRTPQQSTLFLAEFVMVLTSFAPEQVCAQAILAIYRCRWQIELAIKRLKSLLDLDLLRAKQTSPLAEVWLYGKLLYAMLLERRMRRKFADKLPYLDTQRAFSYWRIWRMLKTEIAPLITGVMFWQPHHWPLALNVMAERSRKRKLQLLPAAIDLLNHSWNEALGYALVA